MPSLSKPSQPTVAVEMKALARFHRLMQPGIESFRTSDVVNPAFLDFHAVMEQIKAAAKAESVAKGAMKLQQAA